MNLRKQRQLYNKMNSVNANKKSINELLGNISLNVKEINVNTRNKVSILKILISVILTTIFLGIIYFVIAKLKLGFSYSSLTSFLYNPLLLVLLPGCYFFIYYLIECIIFNFGGRRHVFKKNI